MAHAVLLLSGGLDSVTTLAMATAQGFTVSALSFSYGQRHLHELGRAKDIAKSYNVQDHKIIDIDLRAFGGSALTDDIPVPKRRNVSESKDIPVTYVPARNVIFLSFALAYAETIDAHDIFIGVNSLDYSGYPDCRPEFIHAFSNMANLATATGVQGKHPFTIHTPLIGLTKAEIISEGVALGVDYAKTTSCYDPDEHERACGQCDACLLRLKGFEEMGLSDPIEYVA